jgi:hypothetical protein
MLNKKEKLFLFINGYFYYEQYKDIFKCYKDIEYIVIIELY